MAKRIVIYGCEECPDTSKAREMLDEKGIKYAYVDVLSSMFSLKKFLNVRDANPELFAGVVAGKGIGVPVILVDGADAYIDLDNLDFSLLV